MAPTRDRSSIVISLIVLGVFGLGVLWMLFGAARFESATAIRWSALAGKHNDEGIVLYEINGGPTKRRFSRLVLLDPLTGAERALRPLDRDDPFAITDAGEIWTWDVRNKKLYSYALPTLERKQDPDSLARKYPQLLAGIAEYCYVRRPQRLLKITTQRGEHVAILLETGEVVQSDTSCNEPDAPPHEDRYFLEREPDSEREGLNVRGKPHDLIGSTRWLRPKMIDVHGDAKDLTVDGDFLISSRGRLDDKGATRLARVRTDGTEAWSVPLDPEIGVRYVYQRGDTLVLILNPGVRCLNAKTGLLRWQR